MIIRHQNAEDVTLCQFLRPYAGNFAGIQCSVGTFIHPGWGGNNNNYILLENCCYTTNTTRK